MNNKKFMFIVFGIIVLMGASIYALGDSNESGVVPVVDESRKAQPIQTLHDFVIPENLKPNDILNFLIFKEMQKFNTKEHPIPKSFAYRMFWDTAAAIKESIVYWTPSLISNGIMLYVVCLILNATGAMYIIKPLIPGVTTPPSDNSYSSGFPWILNTLSRTIASFIPDTTI